MPRVQLAADGDGDADLVSPGRRGAPPVRRDRIRVLVVRGHQATPWELRPWELLPERFAVSFLKTRSNRFDVSGVELDAVPARALRDLLPRGRVGDLAATALGDRYLGATDVFGGFDIVHAEELSYWFAAEAVRRRSEHGAAVALTVWETLPLLEAFRNRHPRTYRKETLAATDLFLPATERARAALLLEGVEPERIEVCPPGVDVDRFRGDGGGAPVAEHVVLSPGRLVWEKGHQDVLRALAALRRGIVPAPVAASPRVLVVGSGPEEERLRAHAFELGVGDAVSFSAASYDEMPAVYASASCLVLASLPSAGCMLFPGDRPRCFWEEQFGMVLAEAMAAGLPIVASSSGAIPEVAGDSASYFTPGDWLGLARLLAEGPLARPPGERVEYPRERVERYSAAAAAGRLARVYDRLSASSAR
jgi:glycosyltransferase involved in cell wall biosynthesis